MFCEKCGAQISDNSKFCEKCGNPVAAASVMGPAVSQEPQQQYYEEPVQGYQQQYYEEPVQGYQQQYYEEPVQEYQTRPVRQPKQKKPINKKLLVMIIAIAAVAAAAIIAVLLIKNKAATINLDKYVSVEFSGYDTMGTAEYHFDTEAFVKDNAKKLKLKNKEIEKYYGNDKEAIARAFASSLAYCGQLSQTSELSEGDEVTYSWTLQDSTFINEFKVKWKYNDIKFTVKGLTPVVEFDPFDDIEVVFDGIAPSGKATIINHQNRPISSELYYYITNDSGLSNGDTVTVTVDSGYYDDFASYCVKNYGMKPAKTEMTYTVSGLAEYVTALDQIPANAMSSMQKQAQDVFLAEIADDYDDTVLNSYQHIGSYLLTSKDMTNSWYDKNRLYIVLQVSATLSKYSKVYDETAETSGTYFFAVEFYDIYALNGTAHWEEDGYAYNWIELEAKYPKKGYTVEDGFIGYNTVEDMYNDLVQHELTDYKAESTVKPVDMPVQPTPTTTPVPTVTPEVVPKPDEDDDDEWNVPIQAENFEVMYCDDFVSLRDKPSTKGNVLVKVPLGEIVTFESDAENGFYEVSYGDYRGYMLTSYLVSMKGSTPKPVSAATVTGVSESITLRKYPSTEAEEFCQIPVGETIVYYEPCENGFSMVSYDGFIGYSLTKYLSVS